MKELIALVRSEIGPVAAFKDAVFVGKLPKTRSGKTPRGTLQKMCNGKEYTVSGYITLLLTPLLAKFFLFSGGNSLQKGFLCWLACQLGLFYYRFIKG